VEDQVTARLSQVSDIDLRTPTSPDGTLPAPILRLRLAGLLAAQLFDYGTFTLMVQQHGIHAELNPIVAHGFQSFGLPMIALVKLALVVLIGSIIVVLAHDRTASTTTRRIAAFVTIVAVIGGLVGGISNVAATH
jgi:hypothetical protein